MTHPKKKRRTYPMTLVAECRQMSAGGWSAYAIHRILVERLGDQAPAASTVLYWVDERRYEHHKTRSRNTERRRIAKHGAFTLRLTAKESREEFVQRLGAEGIPAKWVAAATRVVLNEPFTEHQAEYLLSARRGRATNPASTIRRTRQPQGATT